MPDQVDWRRMERDESPGRSVGRLLRDQRLARGVSVDDVAARLRIRSRYLEAIEQGNFDQLPGAAYIPAFLRAYAHHLGLDADKVMTAYQLSGPVPIERPVALPADFPLVEKRAPIGLAVLTVLLVFGAGHISVVGADGGGVVRTSCTGGGGWAGAGVGAVASTVGAAGG